MRVEAFAKVNLSLHVRARRADGFHPIRSLAQSIDWADTLSVDVGEEDAFTVHGDASVPGDETNLAWRAVEAVRRHAVRQPPIVLDLQKRIPSAAGLGGGSADAAAALHAVAALVRFTGDLSEIAGSLGADVPFCLTGGTAWMEGRGEQLTVVPTSDDYVLGVVVPPVTLGTAEVYAAWDRLGGPQGPSVGGRSLPVSLRPLGPFANDLVPAAVAVAPELGDWMADITRSWGQGVLMSGSGSSLFGFFPSMSEAEDAVASIGGVRAARACRIETVGSRRSTSETSEGA